MHTMDDHFFDTNKYIYADTIKKERVYRFSSSHLMN